MKAKTINFFSLFASSSTLICCALPALFVAVGAGASFASLITLFPFLITLSHYKVYITLFALVMLVIAGYMNHKTRHLPCPAEHEHGVACMHARKRAGYVYSVSVGLFLFATIFTYVVPSLL